LLCSAGRDRSIELAKVSLDFDMATSSRPRARRGARTIALRAAAYFAATWGTLAILAAGAFPGAALVVLGLAAYYTLPLVLYIRWRSIPTLRFGCLSSGHSSTRIFCSRSSPERE